MEKKMGRSRSAWIAFLCLGLLPCIALGAGIYLLTTGVRIEYRFVITYVLIPCVCLGLLALCLFSGGRPWLKGIVSVLIMAVFAGMFCLFWFSGFIRVKRYKGEEAVRRYTALQQEHRLLPELSQLTDAVDIEYFNAVDNNLFASEANYLICSYAPEEYEAQKAELDTEYTFQTEPVTLRGDNCQPAAEIDGYVFRMLSVTAYSELGEVLAKGYPKRVILIGCSDQNKEILYMVFENDDLDSISSLEELLQDECGWKYIR